MDTLQCNLSDPTSDILNIIKQVNNTYGRKNIQAFNTTLFYIFY